MTKGPNLPRIGCIVWLLVALRGVGVGASEDLTRYLDSAGNGEAVIRVFAQERASYRIPRTIYGTFLEHIGQSIFGGVSAQLLDNPSLEPYPATPEVIAGRFSAALFRQSTRFSLPLPWVPLSAAGRRFEQRTANPANSATCLYIMGLADREVGIRQTVYLPVERELGYRGVLFVSSEDGAAAPALSVSLRRHDRPREILTEATLKVPERRGWIKLQFQLRLPAGAVAPLEPVDFALAVRGDFRFSVDEIRLYPADAEAGLDPDVVRLAALLQSPLLRYGGNFSSGYHWRDGVGPLDARPTKINQAWGIPEYNEFGTDELLEFCRRIGSKPQICLNLGSGSVQEARAWVEYCQGAAGSAEGRRRAANGHAEAYPIGAWEFGNELYDDTQLGWYTPDGHAARYLEFYKAIEPIIPTGMPLLATGGELNAYEKWNGALLRRASGSLRYLTTHLVADLEETRNRKADRETIVAADLALPVGVGRAIGGIRRQIEADPATRDRVKVAYSEWLFRSPPEARLPNFDNMGGAVVAAAWLNMLARNADWISIANMTGLLEFGGIYKRRGRTYAAPQFWAMYLYSKYAGDTVIGTETRVGQYDVHGGVAFAPEIVGVPYLDVLGTVDTATGSLSLFVVNRDSKRPQSAAVRLNGFEADRAVKVLTLASHSILDGNDEEHPDAIRPAESSQACEGDTLSHTFPPASVTVFVFGRTR